MFMRSSINYPVVCAQIIRSQLKHGRIAPIKKNYGNDQFHCSYAGALCTIETGRKTL